MPADIITRRFEGSAGELHALEFPTQDRVEVWHLVASSPALVIGSSQRLEDFDTEALAADGVELATRRSGGGAVFIDPDASVWIDVLIPSKSPWGGADLVAAFRSVGACWQRAIDGLGVATDLWDERSTANNQSALVCWAGVGWGELTIDGSKVVGLSQRRTRWGARIQGLAVLDANAARAADWFHQRVFSETGVSSRSIRSAVGGSHLALDRDQIVSCVVAELTRSAALAEAHT